MSDGDDWKWYHHLQWSKEITKNEKAGMSPTAAAEKAYETVENRVNGHLYRDTRESSNAKGNDSGASKPTSSGKSK